LVTEARPGWTPDDLRRYADHLLECFGPTRVLWGSDWPVMLLNSSYPAWLAGAKQFIASRSEAEQTAILNDNAVRFYKLALKTQ